MGKVNIFTDLRDDTLLSQISVIGTHDSATAGIRFPHRITSRCVRESFEEQLAMGVRYFDIRLNLVKGELIAYHGLACCYISWREIQGVFEKFLTENPREIVFVRVLRADDTFRRKTTDQEWKDLFYKESCGILSSKYSDGAIGWMRGRIVCINFMWKAYAPYISNDDYTLRATDKDVATKIDNIRRQVGKNVPAEHLNMITLNARGSVPGLPFIPNPERFANKLAKGIFIPTIDRPIWVCCDFPTKFKHLFPAILKRNERYNKCVTI